MGVVSDILKVNKKATLPTNTVIGKIKSGELAMLQGLRGNIQAQINSINNNLARQNLPLEKYRCYSSQETISSTGWITIYAEPTPPDGYVFVDCTVQLEGNGSMVQLDTGTTSFRRFDDGKYNIVVDASRSGLTVKIIEHYVREDAIEWQVVPLIIGEGE